MRLATLHLQRVSGQVLVKLLAKEEAGTVCKKASIPTILVQPLQESHGQLRQLVCDLHRHSALHPSRGDLFRLAPVEGGLQTDHDRGQGQDFRRPLHPMAQHACICLRSLPHGTSDDSFR